MSGTSTSSLDAWASSSRLLEYGKVVTKITRVEPFGFLNHCMECSGVLYDDIFEDVGFEHMENQQVNHKIENKNEEKIANKFL